MRSNDKMVDRAKARWRIIYDASWGRCFPYEVQYEIGGGWKDWTRCESRWGARFAMWRAKRISKPIGGEMVIYEEPTP